MRADQDAVKALRAMRAERKPTSEMLRYLDGRRLSTIEMMDCFRAAFDLDSYGVGPIGGWFADGSGELNDEAVSALLDAAIAEREGRGTS